MSFIRKIVGGPKVRLTENGYDLDLTYVTPRVVAMAFPASGLQKIYRNSIDDVAQFITDKHKLNYMVFNLSCRKYDYNKFNGKVKQYDWEDHQAPALYTIFQICQQMLTYLEQNTQNTVIIHCNHGKGRTGTIIVSFLIFCNFFETVEEALQFYAKKRFSKEGYGVTQPCQIRYIKYFHQLLLHKKIELVPLQLRSMQISGEYQLPELYIKAINSRSRQEILVSKGTVNNKIKIDKKCLFMGDIFVELMEKNLFSEKQFARVNFNTIFIPDNKNESVTQKYSILRLKANQISPDSLLKKNKGKIDKDFEIVFYFERYCNCDLKKQNQEKNCKCSEYLFEEKMYWEKIYLILASYEAPSKNKAIQLLYGKDQYIEGQQ